MWNLWHLTDECLVLALSLKSLRSRMLFPAPWLRKARCGHPHQPMQGFSRWTQLFRRVGYWSSWRSLLLVTFWDGFLLRWACRWWQTWSSWVEGLVRWNVWYLFVASGVAIFSHSHTSWVVLFHWRWAFGACLFVYFYLDTNGPLIDDSVWACSRWRISFGLGKNIQLFTLMLKLNYSPVKFNAQCLDDSRE